jgi:hypothetical protein
VGNIKKEKTRLIQIIDELDIKAELTPLDITERQIKKKVDEDLAKLHRDEETKWAQRAKVRHIQEGANNTKYFDLVANEKHRKKKIFQLEQDEGTIVGESNIRLFITEYYKRLFGPPEQNHGYMLSILISLSYLLMNQTSWLLTSLKRRWSRQLCLSNEIRHLGQIVPPQNSTKILGGNKRRSNGYVCSIENG